VEERKLRSKEVEPVYKALVNPLRVTHRDSKDLDAPRGTWDRRERGRNLCVSSW
jgi:hypothetical protein